MTRAVHKAEISQDTGEGALRVGFIAPGFAAASEHFQRDRHSGRVEQELNPGLGIMELNSHTCRWPIVVIGSEDIRFCGNLTVQGKPFCILHCQKAYRPNVRKPRPYTSMGAYLKGVLSR